MKLQEKALLRALLTRASGGDHLLRYLPQKLAEEIEAWPSGSPTDFSKLLSQKQWAQTIHFSWFREPLKDLQPETQQIFLSLLDPKKAHSVARMLGLNFAPRPLSPFIAPFLVDELKKKVFRGIEVIDKACLPPSELNILLFLDKNQLFTCIDLLGVHDLSADLRQVVDKELLQKIYSALSAEQLRFLHYCSKQPTKWVSPKLGLRAWDGTKKTLQHRLHARGLTRLARALYKEDESLKWHLLHQLDTGRGEVVEKVLRQKQDLSLLPYFKNQVLHIVKRYQA